jgi:hypothetical protein
VAGAISNRPSTRFEIDGYRTYSSLRDHRIALGANVYLLITDFISPGPARFYPISGGIIFLGKRRAQSN